MASSLTALNKGKEKVRTSRNNSINSAAASVALLTKKLSEACTDVAQEGLDEKELAVARKEDEQLLTELSQRYNLPFASAKELQRCKELFCPSEDPYASICGTTKGVALEPVKEGTGISVEPSPFLAEYKYPGFAKIQLILNKKGSMTPENGESVDALFHQIFECIMNDLFPGFMGILPEDTLGFELVVASPLKEFRPAGVTVKFEIKSVSEAIAQVLAKLNVLETMNTVNLATVPKQYHFLVDLRSIRILESTRSTRTLRIIYEESVSMWPEREECRAFGVKDGAFKAVQPAVNAIAATLILAFGQVCLGAAERSSYRSAVSTSDPTEIFSSTMRFKEIPEAMFEAREASVWGLREEAEKAKEKAGKATEELEKAKVELKAMSDAMFAMQQKQVRDYAKRMQGIRPGDDSPPPAEPRHSFHEEQSVLLSSSPSNSAPTATSTSSSPPTPSTSTATATAASPSPRRKRKSEGGFRDAQEKCDRFVERVVTEEDYSGSTEMEKEWEAIFLTLPKTSRALTREEEEEEETRVATAAETGEVASRSEEQEMTIETGGEGEQQRTSGKKRKSQAAGEGLRRSGRVKKA